MGISSYLPVKFPLQGKENNRLGAVIGAVRVSQTQNNRLIFLIWPIMFLKTFINSYSFYFLYKQSSIILKEKNDRRKSELSYEKIANPKRS